MKPIVVGVGDCRLSTDPESELVTYALGSCVAVIVWDPAVPVGGLAHIMLPESSVDRHAAPNRPYRYADTGIPLLLESACRLGASMDRLVVRLAGGAAVSYGSDYFNIGAKNRTALQHMLSAAGLRVHSEETGGAISRTARLHVGTGHCIVRDPLGGERALHVRRRRPIEDDVGRASAEGAIAVLESMLSVTPVRPPFSGPRPHPPCHAGSVGLRGARSGRLTVLAEQRAAQWLASRFFGPQHSRKPARSQINYLVCELACQFARGILLRLDPAAPIDIEPPTAGIERTAPSASSWLRLDLDAGALALRLELE